MGAAGSGDGVAALIACSSSEVWGMYIVVGASSTADATFTASTSVARDPVNFLAWQMLVGVLPLTLLPLVVDVAPTRWSAAYAVATLYVGVVSTALAFLVWTAVLKHLPAGIASLNMFAIPPIALIASMAVFGERLAGNEWAGIALIGAGLAVLFAIAWRAARRSPQAPVTPLPPDGA
jgi:drug/metabolite transporter (DMT)-like permease